MDLIVIAVILVYIFFSFPFLGIHWSHQEYSLIINNRDTGNHPTKIIPFFSPWYLLKGQVPQEDQDLQENQQDPRMMFLKERR